MALSFQVNQLSDTLAVAQDALQWTTDHADAADAAVHTLQSKISLEEVKAAEVSSSRIDRLL